MEREEWYDKGVPDFWKTCGCIVVLMLAALMFFTMLAMNASE